MGSPESLKISAGVGPQLKLIDTDVSHTGNHYVDRSASTFEVGGTAAMNADLQVKKVSVQVSGAYAYSASELDAYHHSSDNIGAQPFATDEVSAHKERIHSVDTTARIAWQYHRNWGLVGGLRYHFTSEQNTAGAFQPEATVSSDVSVSAKKLNDYRNAASNIIVGELGFRYVPGPSRPSTGEESSTHLDLYNLAGQHLAGDKDILLGFGLRVVGSGSLLDGEADINAHLNMPSHGERDAIGASLGLNVKLNWHLSDNDSLVTQANLAANSTTVSQEAFCRESQQCSPRTADTSSMVSFGAMVMYVRSFTMY